MKEVPKGESNEGQEDKIGSEVVQAIEFYGANPVDMC